MSRIDEIRERQAESYFGNSYKMAPDLAWCLDHIEKQARDIARLEALDSYEDLADYIHEALPYYYDDGEDPPDIASPEECADYAATEIRTLKRRIAELEQERDRARAERDHYRAWTRTPRTEDEWHEDEGPALWWSLPICEPPYAGTPLDDDFPDYVTHWTPIVEPHSEEEA